MTAIIGPTAVQVEALERKLQDLDPEAADLAQALARHGGPDDAEAAALHQQAQDFDFEAALHTLRACQAAWKQGVRVP